MPGLTLSPVALFPQPNGPTSPSCSWAVNPTSFSFALQDLMQFSGSGRIVSQLKCVTIQLWNLNLTLIILNIREIILSIQTDSKLPSLHKILWQIVPLQCIFIVCKRFRVVCTVTSYPHNLGFYLVYGLLLWWKQAIRKGNSLSQHSEGWSTALLTADTLTLQAYDCSTFVMVQDVYVFVCFRWNVAAEGHTCGWFDLDMGYRRPQMPDYFDLQCDITACLLFHVSASH